MRFVKTVFMILSVSIFFFFCCFLHFDFDRHRIRRHQYGKDANDFICLLTYKIDAMVGRSVVFNAHINCHFKNQDIYALQFVEYFMARNTRTHCCDIHWSLILLRYLRSNAGRNDIWERKRKIYLALAAFWPFSNCLNVYQV